MSTRNHLPTRLLDAAVELMGRAGRYGTVRVCGSSMEPTLHPGQLLAVDFSERRPRRGDLILFRQGDLLVVHRCLGRARRTPGAYRARGDGVNALDPAVAPEAVVGRVAAVHDSDGWRWLEGRVPRTLATCFALHDLTWSALGVLAERVGRRLGLGRRLQAWVAVWDRRLFRWAFRLAGAWSRTPGPDPRPAA